MKSRIISGRLVLLVSIIMIIVLTAFLLIQLISQGQPTPTQNNTIKAEAVIDILLNSISNLTSAEQLSHRTNIIESLYAGNPTLNDLRVIINQLNESGVSVNLNPNNFESITNTEPNTRFYNTTSSKKIQEELTNQSNNLPCIGITEKHYYGKEALRLFNITSTQYNSAYARTIKCTNQGNYTIGAILSSKITIPLCQNNSNQLINGWVFRNCVRNNQIKSVIYNNAIHYGLIMNDFNKTIFNDYQQREFLKQFT